MTIAACTLSPAELAHPIPEEPDDPAPDDSDDPDDAPSGQPSGGLLSSLTGR